MPSTYSPNLKIELIPNGEQDGTWGSTTNTNFGTALEESIVGSVDVTFASADVTLGFANSNAAQPFRNLRLRLVGTTGGARNLIVPNIEKLYYIKNDAADTVTIKTASGSGVAVPTGKAGVVYVDGVNVVEAVTQLNTLNVGTLTAASPAFTGTPTATTAAPGTNTTQIATTAFVTAADTAAIAAERTATATLTNKTISADDNTLSGIAASSFVLSNASGNIDGSAAQKAIPSGAVVGTTDTQTLTNKTINGSQLVDASVATAKIADANITAAKLDGAQSGSAPIYGARAWGRFNGSTVAILASGNIASFTQNSTGNYSVTFTTAMADANYAVMANAKTADSTSSGDSERLLAIAITRTTSGFTLITFEAPNTNNFRNPVLLDIVVFR